MKQANQPFHYTDTDGVDHLVQRGDIFDDNDPVVANREPLFDTLVVKAGKVTETIPAPAPEHVEATEEPVVEDEPSSIIPPSPAELYVDSVDHAAQLAAIPAAAE